jgi:hypothetical protein
MVGAGCVNDRIGRTGGIREYIPIIQGADNRVNPPRLQQDSFLARAD